MLWHGDLLHVLFVTASLLMKSFVTFLLVVSPQISGDLFFFRAPSSRETLSMLSLSQPISLIQYLGSLSRQPLSLVLVGEHPLLLVLLQCTRHQRRSLDLHWFTYFPETLQSILIEIAIADFSQFWSMDFRTSFKPRRSEWSNALPWPSLMKKCWWMWKCDLPTYLQLMFLFVSTGTFLRDYQEIMCKRPFAIFALDVRISFKMLQDRAQIDKTLFRFHFSQPALRVFGKRRARAHFDSTWEDPLSESETLLFSWIVLLHIERWCRTLEQSRHCCFPFQDLGCFHWGQAYCPSSAVPNLASRTKPYRTVNLR